MTSRSLILALAAALPGVALAQTQTSYSVDAEFVRPTFGNDSFSAVDVATQRKAFAVRAGLIAMYTRDPVTLYDRLEGTELGAVVTDRGTFMLGASMDLSDRVTLNALIPVAVNSPGEPGDPKLFEAPGFGMSDIGIGGRLTAVKGKHFGLGVRAGLIFPSSTRDAYLGDAGFRPHGGLLAHVDVGRTLIATDLGVMGRPDVLETKEDFTYGTELNWNWGIRHKLPDATRLGFTGQVMSRAGLLNFGGPAETSLEGMAGVQVYPKANMTLDVSAGRGFTQGYATTDLRVLGGLTVEFVPKEPVVPPPPPVIPPPVEIPPVVDIIEPEVIETEEIVYKADKIEFKEEPQFVKGTTQLLTDKDRAMVKKVAEFVRDRWEIAHIVIEGHASIEGSYEYNYNLSQGRARTIWEEFVKAGIHPDRVSFRGRGEVVPRVKVADETNEEKLQENRRIEFYVTHQLDVKDPNEEEPVYYNPKTQVIVAPWNGQPLRVTTPERPAIEEEKQPDFFNTTDDIGIGDEPKPKDAPKDAPGDAPKDEGDTGDTGDTEGNE
ncbi:MAG: OmpA family protein [Alphaproteobacteria bacterium]|nr:OmpA family protein [Alphaproteobacteria bacterium]